MPRTEPTGSVFGRSATVFDAPAKINLALHVVGKRADGYHQLESLAVFTEFGDKLSVAPSPSDTFGASGRFADAVPLDGTNLVLRARDALRAITERGCPPVALSLEKTLPVASGIGGGSSDAAAALKALAEHWRLSPDADLRAIGAKLGADVPMCLVARPLVARGIGDRIDEVKAFPALNLVLVNPGIAVSTASVFRLLTRTDNPPLPPLPTLPNYDQLVAWLRSTHNDLQDAAATVAPSIADALEVLSAEGSDFARMSGSGATCFGLFRSRESGQRAATAIRAVRPTWFVETTVSKASET